VENEEERSWHWRLTLLWYDLAVLAFFPWEVSLFLRELQHVSKIVHGVDKQRCLPQLRTDIRHVPGQHSGICSTPADLIWKGCLDQGFGGHGNLWLLQESFEERILDGSQGNEVLLDDNHMRCIVEQDGVVLDHHPDGKQVLVISNTSRMRSLAMLFAISFCLPFSGSVLRTLLQESDTLQMNLPSPLAIRTNVSKNSSKYHPY
jgi:hypothetical protein